MYYNTTDWSCECNAETINFLVNEKVVYGYHWKSEQETKFVMIVVHGLNSCSAFYSHFLRELVKHNGAGIACDNIGSGRSHNGVPNCTTIEENCKIIKEEIHYAKLKYPNIPIFLMGHSCGGLTSLYFALQHFVECSFLNGMIVVAPWLDTDNQLKGSKVKAIGLRVLDKIYPSFQIQTGISVFNSTYSDEYKNSAHSTGFDTTTITPKLLVSCMDSMDFVNKSCHLFPKNLPLLFVQGTADTLVSPYKNIDFLNSIKEKNGEDLISLIVVDDAPHSILKSVYRDKLTFPLFEFVNKHLSD